MLLPLGDSFTGLCMAQPQHPVEPEDARLTLCNLGYARGECPRFPAAFSADAVRFALSRDDGQSLQIYYVLEGAHHPLDHGLLIYRLPEGAFSPALPDAVFEQQAAAYAASYLRRKTPAAVR